MELVIPIVRGKCSSIIDQRRLDTMLLSIPVSRPPIWGPLLRDHSFTTTLEIVEKSRPFRKRGSDGRKERQNYHKTISDICTPTVQLCAVHYYNFKISCLAEPTYYMNMRLCDDRIHALRHRDLTNLSEEIFPS